MIVLPTFDSICGYLVQEPEDVVNEEKAELLGLRKQT